MILLFKQAGRSADVIIAVEIAVTDVSLSNDFPNACSLVGNSNTRKGSFNQFNICVAFE